MERCHGNADGHSKELMLQLAKLHSQGLFHDLTVKCDQKDFFVHRVMLAARSDWFQKACPIKFKEGRSICIELHEDDEKCIAHMIQFCYEGTYDDSKTPDPMTHSVKMFATAEKYLITPLQAHAARRLSHHILNSTNNWDLDIVSAIKQTYANTSDPSRILRDTIVDYFATYAHKVFGDAHLDQDYTSIRDATKQIPEFAADVLRMVSKGRLETQEPPHKCDEVTGSGVVTMWASQMTVNDKGKRTFTCVHCGLKQFKSSGVWEDDWS